MKIRKQLVKLTPASVILSDEFVQKFAGGLTADNMAELYETLTDKVCGSIQTAMREWFESNTQNVKYDADKTDHYDSTSVTSQAYMSTYMYKFGEFENLRMIFGCKISSAYVTQIKNKYFTVDVKVQNAIITSALFETISCAASTSNPMWSASWFENNYQNSQISALRFNKIGDTWEAVIPDIIFYALADDEDYLVSMSVPAWVNAQHLFISCLPDTNDKSKDLLTLSPASAPFWFNDTATLTFGSYNSVPTNQKPYMQNYCFISGIAVNVDNNYYCPENLYFIVNNGSQLFAGYEVYIDGELYFYIGTNVAVKIEEESNVEE